MLEKLFLDVNIIIDLLAIRNPHYESSAVIASLAEKNLLTICTSSNSFSTAFYLLQKGDSSKRAIQVLRNFKVLCEIATVDDQIVEKALNSEFDDLEDAIQYFSAVSSGCQVIITRNRRDFAPSTLPVMSADEFLSGFKNLPSLHPKQN